jgi:hypothetical protein
MGVFLMKRGMHVMITDLFEQNKVLYQKANVPDQLVELQLEESILEYLYPFDGYEAEKYL